MITRDEWLSALQEASTVLPEQDPDLMTARELGELLKCSVGTAKRKAVRLIEVGKAERSTKLIRMPDGSLRSVPAYRLRK
jgi:hypothetical protein